MFLLRLCVLAVFAIMLLPAGPQPGTDEIGRRLAHTANFCQRYPKTCEASGEVFDAFKQKLAYGITLARQHLASQAAQNQGTVRAHDGASPFAAKLDGRYAEWPVPEAPRRGALPSHALSLQERSSEWPRRN